MTVVNTTMEFLKQTSGKRKILNTTSVYGNLQTSSTGNFQYSAMKAALSNFTVNLAKKYSDKEVNVNAIAPG
jgi:NAD(P)-dependent dehydrogenase (short-subunit alcohol dehydrogenase family)